MATVTVTRPPDAGPAPEDAASKPHHVLSRSGATTGFTNTSPSFGGGVGFFTIGRKMLTLALTGKLNSPDTTPPTVAVRKPNFLATRGASDKLRATWLGHACYFVEFPTGLRVLFDPVFEDRCSPFSFLGPKRFTPRPCDIADIPVVDAVVISHSHYDHLSTPSVREIQKHHPDAHFFVGLGLETWFRSAGVNNVTELDWWDDVDIAIAPTRRPGSQAAVTETKSVTSSADGSLPSPPPEQPIRARISCLPAQHTSGRTGLDKDKTLWCSWGVRSGAHSVFFGGDTGYRAVETETEEARAVAPIYPGFAQIGRLRGPFDLGLIPIGAYAPRRVFSPMHADPVDAVEIFRDTACRRAMGIHWGTWALTVEDVLEPPRLLREALKKRGIAETGVFDVSEIGESREF